MIHGSADSFGKPKTTGHPRRSRSVRTTDQGSPRRVPHRRSGSLELIRFLQVAQTLTVHHGALAFLLGINGLRASEAAGVRIEHYAETLRGHRVLRLVGKGNKPATMTLTVPRPARPGDLPGRAHNRPADLGTAEQQSDRSPRRLSDGAARREDGRHPSPRQSALAAACRNCQRPRPRRPAPRRPRSSHVTPTTHHRALRPRTRQPRPARR